MSCKKDGGGEVFISDEACDEIVASYNGYEKVSEINHDAILAKYVNDESYIYLINVNAYNKNMFLLVNICEDEVKEVEVISHNETHDYGDYIEEDWFTDRLLLSTKDQLVLTKISKQKENEVVAITGATITSEAAIDAVNTCINEYNEEK